MKNSIEQSLSERDKALKKASVIFEKKVINHFQYKNKALDIGTGKGNTTFVLSKYFNKVVSIDNDKKSLNISRKKVQEKELKNIEFIKMDAHNLTFPDNSFDVVTCRAAIHHFDNPDKNLSAIHRILNKNGFIVIMDFCFSEIAKQALTSLCMLREDDFRNYFTFHDYCNYLESNSFEIDTIYTYTLPRVLEEWVSVAPRNVQQRILNAFFKLDERILKELNIREDNNKHYMIYRIVEIIAKKS